MGNPMLQQRSVFGAAGVAVSSKGQSDRLNGTRVLQTMRTFHQQKAVGRAGSKSSGFSAASSARTTPATQRPAAQESRKYSWRVAKA